MQWSPTQRVRPVKHTLIDPLKVSQIGALIFGNVLCRWIYFVKFRALQVVRGRGFLDHDVGEHWVMLDQDIGHGHGIMVMAFSNQLFDDHGGDDRNRLFRIQWCQEYAV